MGAWPLGLEQASSDVDVLCEAGDLDRVADVLATRLRRWAPVELHRRGGDGQPDALVARCGIGDVPVEVFAQPLPVVEQRGWRHLQVERRLLRLGGPALAAGVRRHRARVGGSLEPAFAAALGLPGDPYAAVLQLERRSDAALRDLLRGCAGVTARGRARAR